MKYVSGSTALPAFVNQGIYNETTSNIMTQGFNSNIGSQSGAIHSHKNSGPEIIDDDADIRLEGGYASSRRALVSLTRP